MLTSDLSCIASILRTYERKNYATPVINPHNYPYGTCQKLAGGRGWKQREGHNFLRLRKGRGHEKWAVKRGRVMQMCP